MAPHILIIDPDASAAQITRAGVERAIPEATLEVEPNADLGLLSIERHRPDVVIIDPPLHSLMTGRLIQSLKEIDPEAQVIVLASSPTPVLRRYLQHMGADVYLAKPAPLTTLIEAVRQAIEAIRRHRQENALPGAASA